MVADTMAVATMAVATMAVVTMAAAIPAIAIIGIMVEFMLGAIAAAMEPMSALITAPLHVVTK